MNENQHFNKLMPFYLIGLFVAGTLTLCRAMEKNMWGNDWHRIIARNEYKTNPKMETLYDFKVYLAKELCQLKENVPELNNHNVLQVLEKCVRQYIHSVPKSENERTVEQNKIIDFGLNEIKLFKENAKDGFFVEKSEYFYYVHFCNRIFSDVEAGSNRQNKLVLNQTDFYPIFRFLRPVKERC